MAAKKSLYEILGVEPDANDVDIGLAFQRRTYEMARMANADPNGVALVQQAHEILSNPKRRAAYDSSRVTAAEKAAATTQAPDLVLDSGEETEESGRPKWMIPALVVVVLVAVVGFFAMRSGTAPQKAAPVAEAPKPAPPPPPQPLRAEQILPAALRASGQLMSYSMSGAAVPLGIAFSLEPGMVVTSCHGLAAGAKPVFRQGSETVSAELTIVDEVLDLCRLSVPGSGVTTLAPTAEDTKVGDKVFTLGMNAKGEFALTEGTVKQVRNDKGVKVLDVSTPVAPSGTGGPVLDAFGRVAGIAVTPHRFGDGVNAAIASSSLAEMRSRARTP